MSNRQHTLSSSTLRGIQPGRGRGTESGRGNHRGGRGRGRGRGGGRGGNGDRHNNKNCKNPNNHNSNRNQLTPKKSILILHGNRQTGQLLLGRIDKLRKALLRDIDLGWEMIAPEAPHLFHDGDEDAAECEDSGVEVDATNLEDYSNSNKHNDPTQWQRTWWHRKGNTYDGLDESLSMIQKIWDDEEHDFVGVMGFSQGSRLAHILAMIHKVTNGVAFSGLQHVVHASGYGDVPMPDNLPSYLEKNWGQCIVYDLDVDNVPIIMVPSLHVMGESDNLIPLSSSQALMECYHKPAMHVHPGGHHLPVKANDVQQYIEFWKGGTQSSNNENGKSSNNNGRVESTSVSASSTLGPKATIDDKNATTLSATKINEPPDEEHAQAQIDEVSALTQIFPDEFKLISHSSPVNPNIFDPEDYSEDNRSYEHPIRFSILLQPQDDFEKELWPSKNISLGIQYPPTYPDVSPIVSLIHDMNYFEFSSHQSEALMTVLRTAMAEEEGMPCVMGLVYAARDFFEGGGLAASAFTGPASTAEVSAADDSEERRNTAAISSSGDLTLRPSSAKRIEECNAQGLQIATAMLGRSHSDDVGEVSGLKEVMDASSGGKGGSWKYTIGLVGKPSAGKSTFFNAATAFARQRGDSNRDSHNHDDAEDESEIMIGGAAMAPHPFTTIDPNVGFCLVPAPRGSCPEDDDNDYEELVKSGLILGSTHGRDSRRRRLIPVCLKDVAGLVPGAYQGRGKGNKFLDDLTDADVLIHVVDASGSSDAEGNKVTNDDGVDESNHPINDLAWVRNELVEWVNFNLASRWDSIVRRGKKKFLGMFSGYKQSQSFVMDVFAAVEKYVSETEGRDRIFDNLNTWDEGDLHRLVSAFLGVRFPMALALNKCDIPSASAFINDIQTKLPIHGAHIGVGLSSHEEMKFMRHHIGLALKSSALDSLCPQPQGAIPNGVWDTLQSAMSLRSAVLVFPVNDMKTYEPLPGMTHYATRDASLPNKGMISCITNAGGTAPFYWDSQKEIYAPIITKNDVKPALRDVLLMKPGSIVEDVFLGLKWVGALEGEFVRAEGASRIGEKPKLLSKTDVVGTNNRIIRIMTTKRKEWQKK